MLVLYQYVRNADSCVLQMGDEGLSEYEVERLKRLAHNEVSPFLFSEYFSHSD